MKVKQQKGISLIEILVVVAILLLVLVAVFRSFRSDVNKTQDAQRKTDLRNLRLAFEDYHNDKGAYPPEEFLLDCDGNSLRPYLRSVPCDPQTGEPYLYMPVPGNGDNSRGYRLLSILSNKADPIIEELGCQNGCGVPESNPRYGNSINFVYGVAEGVPLVLDGYVPNITSVPTNEPTSVPTIDPNYCDSHLCFCCANSAYATGQDCNIWVQGNNCDIGPFTTIEACHSSSPCSSQ